MLRVCRGPLLMLLVAGSTALAACADRRGSVATVNTTIDTIGDTIRVRTGPIAASLTLRRHVA